MHKAGIVTFAFGVPNTIRSNQWLVQITRAKARQLSAPVYTQEDFGVDPQPGLFITYTEEERGKPPPTLRIARGAVQWAKQRQITELWIVAARPHLKRCIRDLKYAVTEDKADITVRVSQGIFMFPAAEWFCPDSTQPRTRSRKDWLPRELVLANAPMWLYKKVAS